MLSRDYYAYLEKAREKQDSLMHYGTSGQKWGVRHWQYADGRFNPEGKERYFGTGKNKERTGEDSEQTFGMDPVTAYLAALAAITVAEAGTARAMDAVHNAVVNKRIKKYEENLQTETTDKTTGLKLKANPDSTFEEDMKTINLEHGYNMFSDVGIVAELVSSPKYNEKRNGYTQNCMLCTTAMDLKRRGYDVRAGKSEHGFTADEIKNWYKDPEIKQGNIKNLLKEMKELPEGSYGNFMCTWNSGGGHSMFFRIEKGKVAIYDAQTNRKIKNLDSAFNIYKAHMSPKTDATYYVRTDNLELNIEYLKKNDLIRYK